MKSKISFFNLAIFRKDITRFWPLWVLDLVILQLLVPIPIVSFLSAEIKSGAASGKMKTVLANEFAFYGGYLTDSIHICILCIVIAVFVFSYLTKAKEAYTVHSFPARRETLFFSHYLAGLVMLAIPFLVAYFVVICIDIRYSGGFNIALLAKMAITLIEILLFYHLACLVVMLTGNSIMTVVIYAVTNVLYCGVMYLFSYLGTLFIYGFQRGHDFFDPVTEWLTPVLSLSSFYWMPSYLSSGLQAEDEIEALDGSWEIADSLWRSVGLSRILWYLIPAAAFLALAVVLYRKRSIEAAGDMVAFSWGKPVFRLVFTVCGSVLFTLGIYKICLEGGGAEYTYRGVFPILLVLLIVGCILCYLISNMILYRSFFIWKKTSYVRMAFVAAAVLGVMCYMRSSGYGAKIPDVEQIEMVSLYDIGYGSNVYHMQDKEQIRQFIKLQRDIIQGGEQMTVAGRHDGNIYVVYTLKGGATLECSYPILTNNKEYVAVKRFVENKETVCSLLFTEDYEKVIAQNISVISDHVEKTVIGADSRKLLYQAVIADLKEGNIRLTDTSYEQDSKSGTYLSISIGIPQSVCRERNYSETYQRAMEDYAKYVRITEDSKHTIQALDEIPQEYLRMVGNDIEE